MKFLYLLLIALTPIIIPSQPALPPAQDFPDVCQEPDNILPNCNFNNGLDGWVPYLENGSANITVQQGGSECHAPLCPAAYIVTEGSFVGGIYQQVPVTPGNTYYANIVWLAFDSFVNAPDINAAVGGIGRRIGIDPTGGTDSTSPTVVWSEDNWRNDCKICNVEHVTATAQADKITVFIRIDDTWRARAAEKGYSVPPSRDQFWLDDAGLKQVAGSAAPPPTETPPPPPPTDTPVPEPLIDAAATEEAPTNTPAPAETPAEVAQLDSPAREVDAPAEQPESPLATPREPAREVAPPPTLTPSATPSPSPTFERRATPTATRQASPEIGRAEAQPSILSAGVLGTIGTTACLGGFVLVVLGGVLGGAVWLYRLGWGQTDDDDFDDIEEIPVEVVE